jgi:hypothetical protein
MKPHSAASGTNVVYVDHTNSAGECPAQSTADPTAVASLIRDSFLVTGLIFAPAEIEEDAG